MKRFYSCFFSLKGSPQYPRMARVLAHTARKHLPDWEVRVDEIAAPEAEGAEKTWRVRRRHGLATNTDKLRDWVAAVDRCDDGDLLALVDADAMVTASLDPILDLDFDVAYTRKEGAEKLPINGGVVFVRVNARSRAFMRRWREENDRLYARPEEHAPWREHFGGMNQAAFGRMLTTGEHPPATLLPISAHEWNACWSPAWRQWKRARIVHIKSGLRRTIFGAQRPENLTVREFVEFWRATEREVPDGP